MRRKKKGSFIALIVVAVLLIVGMPHLKSGADFVAKLVYPRHFQKMVETYAARYELPESLIYAVIHTESHFDPQAVSKAQAKGLMQLTDNTCDWARSLLGETDGDVFDPETNVRYGTKILSVLCGEFSEIKTALAAYNAGIGNVRKWLKNTEYSTDGTTLHTIPFQETREYVVRVQKAQKRYQTLYDIP
ncbi:MAG: lytic transglycosylase domain-containing protein [Clostridia bacterium]|nr:lytic transglycosylase domain-containing protein [Clostridia bacterium]